MFGYALPGQYPIKGFQLTLYPLFLPTREFSSSPKVPLSVPI